MKALATLNTEVTSWKGIQDQANTAFELLENKDFVLMWFFSLLSPSKHSPTQRFTQLISVVNLA